MAPSDQTTERMTATAPANDNACTHCRERKIRCGRERPKCRNCKRDGVECAYSNPAKRVNHIKLLCNNFGTVEDRLSNIETQLLIMNSHFKTNNHRGSSSEALTEEQDVVETSDDELTADFDPHGISTDRHVVHSPSSLTDRYHGPCTLFALCNELSETLTSPRQSKSPSLGQGDSQHPEDKPPLTDAATSLLSQICLEAATEEVVDLHPTPSSIRLPPKQLLLMATTQFLQQADYTTDIFVPSCFSANIERIYNKAFTAADEPWAICFNTIVLLVLGPETTTQDCDSLTSSQFLRPFLLTVRYALSNPGILMAAKMINVQTLALLTIVAQLYFPLGLSESIFAQACVLARMMGLHQVPSAGEGSSQEDTQQRLKTFTSLYLRDKSLSNLQGSICWLPSSDCSLSCELNVKSSAENKSVARIQLAKLQDECYRLFHSAESGRGSSTKCKQVLLRLEQGFDSWARFYGLRTFPSEMNSDAGLQLEFFAARISVFRRSSETSHLRQAMNDSRATCLLLIVSWGKHDPPMIDALEHLLGSRDPLRSPRSKVPVQASKLGQERSLDTTVNGFRDSAASRSNPLLETFSAAAFFLLATNIMQPSSIYRSNDKKEDMDLLQRTCACYQDLGRNSQLSSHARKARLAFEKLLQLINLSETSQQGQLSVAVTQKTNHISFSPNSSRNLGETGQNADPSSLASQSTYPIPSLPWSDFSGGDPPIRALGSPNNSLGLQTPVQSALQRYDSFHNNMFYPDMQQHELHTPDSNGQPTKEADVSMDGGADSRLFFGFSSDPLMQY